MSEGPPSAPSTERRVRAADGTEILVREWPAPAAPVAHVLLVHGLGEHSGRYEHVAGWLARAGFAVHAYDHRCFGGSRGARAWVDSWSVLHADLAERVSAVAAAAEGRPVAVYGHSLGGLIVLGAVLDDRIRPDLLVQSAPAIGATIPPVTRFAISLLGRFRPRTELPNGLRGERLSRDPEVGRRYIEDPRNHHRTTARFGVLAFAAQARCRLLLDRLTTPTLVIHGADDTIVPARVSEPLAALPAVERRVYPGIRHELHNEPEGEAIVGEVAAWLRGRVEFARPTR
jgi:alpha-beta hydrolase superfamily lysophospholipase